MTDLVQARLGGDPLDFVLRREADAPPSDGRADTRSDKSRPERGAVEMKRHA